jgi:hypothetical protein
MEVLPSHGPTFKIESPYNYSSYLTTDGKGSPYENPNCV